MKLNEDKSWLLFFSKYFKNESYSSYANLPSNLCPLFWQGVGGFLLMLTTPFFTILLTLKSKFNKRMFLEKNYDIFNSAWKSWLIEKIYILIYFMQVGLSYSLLNEDLSMNIPDIWFFTVLWLTIPVILLVIVVISFLLYRGIDLLIKNINSKNISKKESKPNVIIEMVKAKYNNYCPQITWTKDE